MSFVRRVAPRRSAFLHEGPDPLLPVRQSQVVHHHSGGGGVGGVSTLSHLPGGREGKRLRLVVSTNVAHSRRVVLVPVERGLAEGDDRSAELTHVPGDGQGGVLQSVLGHHPTDEAVQQSVVGGDGASCEQHLHGNLRTHAGRLTDADGLETLPPPLSLAFLGTALPMGTAGVEQNRPTLTPGVAKVDFSDATAMSQLATSWQPAAVATPFTMAMTGTGTSCIRVITCSPRDEVVVKGAGH